MLLETLVVVQCLVEGCARVSVPALLLRLVGDAIHLIKLLHLSDHRLSFIGLELI